MLNFNTMKKIIILLFIPFLNFGQNNQAVSDTVKLVAAWQGVWDDIFTLDFQSITSKLETVQFFYTDTDGDGKRNYEKPSSIKKDTTLEEYIISFDQVGWENSKLSFSAIEELIDSVFIIHYNIKKYKLDCSDDILTRYKYKTGNYLIGIEKMQ